MNAPTFHNCLRLVVLTLLATGLALALAKPAQAATFTIPCTNGMGDGDALHAAVNTSNTNDQEDTINLVSGCTYQLSTALFVYADNGKLLTINGNGATIRGGRGANRHIMTIQYEALPGVPTSVAARVMINRTTLTGGIADSFSEEEEIAGAIMSWGFLTINQSTITGNSAVDHNPAIFQTYNGALTLNQTTVSGNRLMTGGRLFFLA